MTEVFADTSYFYALLSPADDAHAKAHELTRKRTEKLVTTAWVLTELGNTLSPPPLRGAFLRTLQALRADSNAEEVKADAAVFERGIDLFSRRGDKAWSLTDCISFVVMQERGITHALSTDHHFEQAGFTALLR